MLTKRIIPCLDVQNERVVKGVQFADVKDAGDPVGLAKFYSSEGADELTFLDITASLEQRNVAMPFIAKVAKVISIPFMVGGGINSIETIRRVLQAGADKVSLNTSAVNNPEIISKAANIFGSQCIVLAIDAKKEGSRWEVFSNGGTTRTELDVISWAKEAVQKGIGEILLTSIDADGTKYGFDIELTKAVSEAVLVPVIASGGAGKISDFSDVFTKGKADGALAASVFHNNELSISQVKKYLCKKGVPVRI